MEPEIVYEDSDLLVINKPSGLVVNRAITVRQPTLQDWLESYLGQTKVEDDQANDFTRRSGIVHRLDKDTSGLLVVAKNLSSFTDLTCQFAKRQVKKTYLALVHGRVQPEAAEITAPIARNPFDREKFGIFPGGREAKTSYRLCSFWQSPRKDELTLVEVSPETGRTHQIRVHFKYAGWPLVSDPVYLGRKRVKQDQVWCPRLFLHAAKIVFHQPPSGGEVEVGCRLPEDLDLVMQGLNKI